jgi:trk system potassium uptake protein TrkH
VVLGVLLATGVPLSRLAAPRRVQTHEALVLVAVAFTTGALLMSWPLASAGLGSVDALFEAVSGITTTGLSTLSSVEELPASFLFARAWMQWYGGLGIVVLALALVLGPGVAARRLAAGDSEDLVAGTHARARRLLGVYGSLTALAFAALWLLGAPGFDALLHALTAVSTGGFSSHDTGSSALGSGAVRAGLAAASLLGAVSFSLQYRAWTRGPGWLLRDREIQALLIACLLSGLLLGGCMVLAGGRAWSDVAAHAPFLAVSAQTTTGFATLEVRDLDPASKLVLIASMTIGGDMGSTAGGIKIFRLLVALRLVHMLLARSVLPSHAVLGAQIGSHPLQAREIQETLAVLLLFPTVAAASWVPFLALGFDPLDSLFEIVSALGTVGLSAGVTGPDLAPGLKLLLCLDMLMGRLEIVAFLVLFYPRTWFGRRAEAQ